MSKGDVQPNCPYLQQKLEELKSWREKYAEAAVIFAEQMKTTTQYDRGAWEEMDGEREKFEEEFKQIYEELSRQLFMNKMEKLREPLKADYEKQLKTLEWYGILETAEDGEKYYIADYDGSSEKDPNDTEEDESKRRPCPDAHNFSGEKFKVPALEDIMKALTPVHVALYKEYQEKGLEPRLQLTPLALKLRTMAEKLDAKKEEINAKAGETLIQDNNFIWDLKKGGKIDETTLLYEPKVVEASINGQELITKNGLTKAQLIRKYNGFLVEIVQMKPDLEADADKTHKEIEQDGKIVKIRFTHAEKTALYAQEARSRGEHGLGYEDYLQTQMTAFTDDIPYPLESVCYTILPESSLTKNTNLVSIGGHGPKVGLNRCNSNSQSGFLRFRRSVRILVG